MIGMLTVIALLLHHPPRPPPPPPSNERQKNIVSNRKDKFHEAFFDATLELPADLQVSCILYNIYNSSVIFGFT